MSKFNVEALIDLVQKHVYLYDITHKKYKDANMKAATWNSIAQQLNRNCDAVKHKWKTVRDGYIKYKKQMRQAEESGKTVIEYVWSTQLAFLDNYHVTRRANPILNYALQPQVEIYEESNTASPAGISPTHTQWDADEDPLSKRRKILEQGDVDQMLSFINSASKKSNDAVDHLFMSYAETFKKFSPRRQAEMKIELAKLFSTAELNELQDFANGDDLQPVGSMSSKYLYAIKTENVET